MKEPHKLRDSVIKLVNEYPNVDDVALANQLISTILKAVESEVIGEDEEEFPSAMIMTNEGITARNELRASQRKLLKELGGLE